MSHEKKAIIILSVALFLVIQYSIFISTSHFNARRYFDEANRVATKTIENLQDNNRQLISSVAGVGDISQKLGELGNSYDELNREREEELRRREELESTATELYSAIGERVQESFRIITEGQRELDSIRAESGGTGEVTAEGGERTGS